jgi:hypothetical protein
MHYNLSEEQKTFLHISYSMLEEGYDVDQIMEFWNLNDESKVLEICESITLSETIDTGNPDFLLICEKGGVQGFLMKLFGRGGKVRLRKPPTTTKGGRPITSGATRPGAKVDPTKPPSLIRKLKDKIPAAQKTKIKQGAAVAGAAGLVTLGTKVALDNKLIPGISDPSTDSKVDTSDPEEKVETPEEKRSREQREAEKAAADAKAAEEAKAKSSSSNNKSAGWWRLQKHKSKDLYKNSPGYQVSLKAYKNIRANPVPSIYNHYEVIADYLIKEGHASDIKEADYVMNQLDEEFIQSIIESSCGSHKKKKKKK